MGAVGICGNCWQCSLIRWGGMGAVDCSTFRNCKEERGGIIFDWWGRVQQKGFLWMKSGTCSDPLRAGPSLKYWAFEGRNQFWCFSQDYFLYSNTGRQYCFLMKAERLKEGNNPGTYPRIISCIQMLGTRIVSFIHAEQLSKTPKNLGHIKIVSLCRLIIWMKKTILAPCPGLFPLFKCWGPGSFPSKMLSNSTFQTILSSIQMPGLFLSLMLINMMDISHI